VATIPCRPAARWIPLGLAAIVLVSSVVVGSAASLPVTTQQMVAYKTCTLTGFVSPSSVADTYVVQDGATNNFGNNADMRVKSDPGKARRPFVRFDLTRCSPSIPAGAIVKHAQLRLFVNNDPPSIRNYEVRRVTAPCPQGLGTCWGETTLTWNNQPSVAGSPTDTVTICSGGACNNQYYAWTVTPDVAAWLAGTAANYGWRVSDAAEGLSNAEAQFRTWNEGRAEHGPQLVIVYVP